MSVLIKIIDMLLDESKKDNRTVTSELRVLLTHMLKCKYQPEYTNKSSWRGSIAKASAGIYDAFGGKLKGSTYRKFYLRDMNLQDIYRQAVRIASSETGIPISSFPKECEWTKSQLVSEDFIDKFIETYGKDCE